MVSDASDKYLACAGDFSMSGGEIHMKVGDGAAEIHVVGNFSKSGGTIYQRENPNSTSTIFVGGAFSHGAGTYYMTSSSMGNGTLYVAGDFSHTGGSIIEGSTAGGTGDIRFNGYSPQAYTSGGDLTVPLILLFSGDQRFD
jgi:hypothetical protein